MLVTVGMGVGVGGRGTGHDLADAERSDKGDSSELHCVCVEGGCGCVFWRVVRDMVYWGIAVSGRDLLSCPLLALVGLVRVSKDGQSSRSRQRSVRALCCSRVGEEGIAHEGGIHCDDEDE